MFCFELLSKYMIRIRFSMIPILWLKGKYFVSYKRGKLKAGNLLLL